MAGGEAADSEEQYEGYQDPLGSLVAGPLVAVLTGIWIGLLAGGIVTVALLLL